MTLESMGPALLVATLAAAVCARFRLQRIAAAVIAAAAGCATLIPINGMSIAGFALALPGSLSAATLMLAGQLLFRSLGAEQRMRPSGLFLICVAASGLLLYATARGPIAFDLYDLGFRGAVVPALMAAFVVAGWLGGARDIPIWIGGAALLYLLGAYPSVNMWDYLLDPVAVVSAALLLLARLWRRNQFANRANSETTRS